MAIQPALIFESIVQVKDLTRLDAALSNITPDEDPITKVEIQPEETADFIDVTDSKYLDWEYATDGEKTASVRITTDGAPVTITRTLSVITEAADNLISNDGDLRAFDQNVMSFLPAGKASYKYVHRQAKQLILDHLAEQGITDINGERLESAAIVKTAQFRKWSTFLSLQIIFEGLSNEVDDVFSKKAEKYGSLALQASKLAQVSLDLNGDGDDEDAGETDIPFSSVRVVRS